MIISRKKFDKAIREAIENENRVRAHAEEQRELRREVYYEMERIRDRINKLECRIVDLEHGKLSKLASEG